MESMPAIFGGQMDANVSRLALTNDSWRVIRASLRDAESHALIEARDSEKTWREWHDGNEGAALACDHCQVEWHGANAARNRAERYKGIIEQIRGLLGEGCPDCIGYPCECGTAGEGC